MKKIALVLAVLLFTVPAMANLSISCTTVGTQVTISYDRGASALPRGFALRIELDNAATITTGPYATNSEYYIYPGSITITGNSVTSWGTPVAEGGVGSSTMIIEMASLYASNDTAHPVAPGNSGAILSFGVSGPSKVTLTEDALRGGVVLEDGSNNGLGSPVTTCQVGLETCHTDYSEWLSVGNPYSWSDNPWQCYGDGNGATELIGHLTYHVGFNDLNVFLAAWQDKVLDYNADFNHASELIGHLTYRVGFNDLNVFLANWQDKAGAAGDCQDCP